MVVIKKCNMYQLNAPIHPSPCIGQSVVLCLRRSRARTALMAVHGADCITCDLDELISLIIGK
jgi:hypothetical protein